MDNISLIAACSSFGVNVNGAEKGAKVLLDKVEKNIKKYEVKNFEYTKENEKENKEKNLEAVNRFNLELYNKAKEVLKNNDLPLTLGGDHSIAIASALASISKYENLGIIWFDAHGDFNTFDTTITGNIHGLPLACITGYERKKLTDFHKGNFYNAKNTVVVGARDLDDLEVLNLKDAGVTVFTTKDVYEKGVEAIVKEALKIAGNGTNGIHISYDLDMIDPKVAPGVSVPAEDGLTEKQAEDIVDVFLEYIDKIKSIDIVEFNPLNDIDGKTEKIALNMIDKILGKEDKNK